MPEVHGRQYLLHPFANLAGRPAQLQRPEGQFIKHGRIEELDIWILKHQSNPLSERVREFPFLEARGRHCGARELERPRFREHQRIQNPQQRRFSRPVCTQ